MLAAVPNKRIGKIETPIPSGDLNAQSAHRVRAQQIARTYALKDKSRNYVTPHQKFGAPMYQLAKSAAAPNALGPNQLSLARAESNTQSVPQTKLERSSHLSTKYNPSASFASDIVKTIPSTTQNISTWTKKTDFIRERITPGTPSSYFENGLRPPIQMLRQARFSSASHSRKEPLLSRATGYVTLA